LPWPSITRQHQHDIAGQQTSFIQTKTSLAFSVHKLSKHAMNLTWPGLR
jgi:hypothetical protein